MTTYKAPLRDMQFVMQDLLNIEKHYQSLPDCEEVNQELLDAILGEASKFSEDIVAPLNAVGDQEGCQMLDNGEVKTPAGFKEAYQQYVDAGWPSLDQPSRYGGQDLPMSIGTTVREIYGVLHQRRSANDLREWQDFMFRARQHRPHRGYPIDRLVSRGRRGHIRHCRSNPDRKPQSPGLSSIEL